tara:strand:- start:708 stop:992 length:285 start_codon:yes stop_codon:yes gene_type:complete
MAIFNKKKPIEYKFDEDRILTVAQLYIDKTYNEHYAGKTQATEFISDSGHGEGFCVGNIIKYASRFGKKSGKNKLDILKIIHYAVILYSIDETD